MIYGWSSGVWTGDIIIRMAMAIAIALDMRNGFVGIEKQIGHAAS